MDKFLLIIVHNIDVPIILHVFVIIAMMVHNISQRALVVIWGPGLKLVDTRMLIVTQFWILVEGSLLPTFRK